jgi:hypothetical protein
LVKYTPDRSYGFRDEDGFGLSQEISEAFEPLPGSTMIADDPELTLEGSIELSTTSNLLIL